MKLLKRFYGTLSLSQHLHSNHFVINRDRV